MQVLPNVEQTMAGILSRNIHRHFTFYGRVLFLKQHVLSQATHLAHVLPCQKNRAETIWKKLGKFLWAKRSEHPPLKVLIRSRIPGWVGRPSPIWIFNVPLHPHIVHIIHKCRGPRESDSRLLVGTAAPTTLPANRPGPNSSPLRFATFHQTRHSCHHRPTPGGPLHVLIGSTSSPTPCNPEGPKLHARATVR